MLMQPTKTALVLIEYQNDFTSDGGSLHERRQVRHAANQHAAEHQRDP